MTGGAAPLVSIVTTCKGRLHHLRRSLPSFLAQTDSEVIVVDYDCPDDTASVCTREFPAARAVKVEDRPLFNTSEARNLGAAQARGAWLAFFDADIVMADDFVARLKPSLGTQPEFHRFFMAGPETYPTCGSCVVRREDYIAIDRYDEVMVGYGGEDQDLYFRLAFAGVKPVRLEFDMLAAIIQHPDRERVRFGPFDTVKRHQQVNDVYCLVKHSLLRHLGLNGLPEPERRRLHSLIRDVVADANRKPDSPIHFAIELPPDPLGMWTVRWHSRRHLVFDLAPNLREIANLQGDEHIG